MSKLIVDGEDLTRLTINLIFECGICKSGNTSIRFTQGFIHASGGDTGALILWCEDCSASCEPGFDKAWVKNK